MSQILHFTTTINAPVSKVRSIMLDHPTYELRTKAFAETSTYEGSREQGSDMIFGDGTGSGMLAKIAENKSHEYLSIQHKGAIDENKHVIQHKGESFENYRFTDISGDATKLDIELTGMPDEWIEMFNEMWPKALDLLKGLCESKVAKLTVSTIVNIPLSQAREIWNNPTHITNWCFASDDRCCPRASNDLQVGGLLLVRMEAKDGSFGFDMTGRYDIVEPLSRIIYTMGEMKEYFLPAGRQVEVVFEKKADNQTCITEHFDAESIHSVEMQIAGWQAILENFKKYIE